MGASKEKMSRLDAEIKEQLKVNLKKRREELKLTQNDVIKQVGGVDATTYRNWEHGKTCPTVGKAYELAETLDCDVDYLFGYQDAPNRKRADLQEETGLSLDAVKRIAELKNNGYIAILSALLESKDFIDALDKIFWALYCKKSEHDRIWEDKARKDPWLAQIFPELKGAKNNSIKDTMQIHSMVSSDFVVVPREAQVISYTQESKDCFGQAIKEALRILRINHALDEKMLCVAQEKSTFDTLDGKLLSDAQEKTALDE